MGLSRLIHDALVSLTGFLSEHGEKVGLHGLLLGLGHLKRDPCRSIASAACDCGNTSGFRRIHVTGAARASSCGAGTWCEPPGWLRRWNCSKTVLGVQGSSWKHGQGGRSASSYCSSSSYWMILGRGF
jgi:hypothetical protein